MPVGLHATKNGMTITFTGELDSNTAGDPKNYSAKTWGLRRSANYGSDHIGENPAAVTAAKLSPDGKTVTLQIEDLKPTWCMEIKYAIKAANGETVRGTIHNTVHKLGE